LPIRPRQAAEKGLCELITKAGAGSISTASGSERGSLNHSLTEATLAIARGTDSSAQVEIAAY